MVEKTVEIPSPKDSFPKAKEAEPLTMKKVEQSVKQLAKKPNTPSKLTTREQFLKKLNAEKDPVKRKMLMAALRGRMFQ